MEAARRPLGRLARYARHCKLTLDFSFAQMQIRRSGKQRVKSIEERAVEVWGVDAQLRQAQEELAELIAAINRFCRGRKDSRVSVIEEIADVEIMCSQLRTIFGQGEVEQRKREKMLRLLKRVEQAEAQPQRSTEEDRWARRMLKLEKKIEMIRKDIES